jgi:cholest-4-en-3-one 26-monooxygenase
MSASMGSSTSKGGAYPMTNQSIGAGVHLMMSDPPVHTRLRRAAAQGFGPKVVRHFEPWIREIVTEVLDGIEGKARFDVVEEFAKTIPAYVLIRVLGIPREDRETLVNWVIEVFDATQSTDGENPAEKVNATNAKMTDYALRMKELKRTQPADDMFTQMGACVDSGELSIEEFLSWMFLTMAAGFETTHTAIGHSMRMYIENPEIAEATDRAIEEGLSGRVVDEYLRLISPPMQMARTATRDVEFCGEQIRKDDVMVNYFISANRDSKVFANPDSFDPWRPEKSTLAFGSGPHHCIGAHLAKLELKILWEELHRRGIKLRLDGQPRRGMSIFINQLRALPVARV